MSGRENDAGREETTVGSYFVSNYPPFSFWRPDPVEQALEKLSSEPAPGTKLGIYVHVPFCRKRCDFCYFRVYTDKDSQGVRRYLDAVIAEMARYAELPYVKGREPSFVYFGGGTPSYLSVEQLRYLFEGLRSELPWRGVEEVTFECEPGTLQEKKVHALSELGVTRLSLGVENFDPEILELNNRAHRAKEIGASYGWARAAGFPQLNIDLIAGMVGETDENWSSCVRQTRELWPDSVTIYQMEIPHNTTVYRRMKDGGQEVAPVADWQTKRRWVDEAFRELESAGYRVQSAYTAVRGGDVRFVYRDGLWRGAEMLGLGVSSFSHLGGFHLQNESDFEPYLESIEAGRLPIARGLGLSDDEKLVREFILQLKLGEVETGYFLRKFGVNVTERFEAALRRHERDGFVGLTDGRVVLTRAGLLRVDRLLRDFFLEEHRTP